MTSPWYNPTFVVRNTRALAEAVNNELTKIKNAFDQLPAPGSVGTGSSPVYTHFAYADSADGTSNFTTGSPANRSYIGVQANSGSATPSAFPEDYTWTRITGTDGAAGQYRDFRYIRSASQPAQPVADEPVGSSASVPTGTLPVWVTSATRNGAGTLITAWDAYERLTAFPPAAAYDAGETYYEGMQVLFSGGTYVLIVASSTGNAPSGTSQANAYWDVIAAPGSQGEPATPPGAFSTTIVLASSSTGANLRTLADAAGYTGMSDATITFEVPNTVTVTGEQSGIGIDSGTWPSGSYTIALTLVVQSGGIVRGGGGAGGSGGSGTAGFIGAAGGDAIFLREDCTGGITIDAGGTVQGGGGGGGGGTGTFDFTSEPEGGAGGGGGGGAPNGSGGTPGSTFNADLPATAGSAGTTGGGGAGGAGLNEGSSTGTAGASGGGYATAGSTSGGVSGGAAGYAVRKNGKTATVTNNGTMTGSAA